MIKFFFDTFLGFSLTKSFLHFFSWWQVHNEIYGSYELIFVIQAQFKLTDLFLNQEKHDMHMPLGAWILDNAPMHSTLPIQRVQVPRPYDLFSDPTYFIILQQGFNISRSRDLIYSLPSILFVKVCMFLYNTFSLKMELLYLNGALTVGSTSLEIQTWPL